MKNRKKSLKQIAKELQIDQGTVSTKLKAMGLSNRIKKRSLNNKKFKCLWCGKENYSWTGGKRQQKYCSEKPVICRNQAKDLRSGKGSIERKIKQLKHLNNIWGKDYNKTLNLLLDKSLQKETILKLSKTIYSDVTNSE